jgi:cytoskeletal protein CcmA (bactofilin family)
MRIVAIVAAFFASLLVAAPALAQMDDIWRAGARVNVTAAAQRDVWAAGAIVGIRGDSKRDIGAFGAEVDVDAASGRDTMVAGAVVSVRGMQGRDLNVAGARIAIESRVGRDLNVAGARVVVGPQAEVAGAANIVGADVLFSGTGKGPVTFHADHVQIDGRIAGDVLVRARQATVGRSAVIDGAVRFETFGEPTIEAGATVRGRQTVTTPQAPEVGVGTIFAALGAVIVFAIGAGLVLGILLLIAARPFVERAIDRIRTAPLMTALVGLVVLILVPLVALLLMVTVIGIPIGLLLLLAFPFTLLTAGALAAFGLSDWLLNRGREPRSWGGRVLLLLVGLIVLTLIGLVPFLGFVSWMLALLIGLGALWHALRAPPASAPAL